MTVQDSDQKEAPAREMPKSNIGTSLKVALSIHILPCSPLRIPHTRPLPRKEGPGRTRYWDCHIPILKNGNENRKLGFKCFVNTEKQKKNDMKNMKI